MSAKPLVFEGPDPEQLLLEAWSRFGTNVKISEPLCVRTGGVGGFFAKLSYRIEVEPADDVETHSMAAASVPGPDYLDSAPRAEMPWGRLRGSGVGANGAAMPSGESARADALSRLIADTEDVFEQTEPPRRSFDEVLHVVASSLGEERDNADLATATRPVAMSDASNVSSPHAAEVRDNSSGGVMYERPTNTSPVRDLEDGPIDIASLIFETATPTPPPPPLREDPMASAPEPLSEPLIPAPAVAATSNAHVESDKTPLVRRELAGIGFPLTLLARLPDDVEDELAAAFDLLPTPRPLPVVPGALIAVVGELGDAFVAAGEIAEALELDEIELCVASPAAPAFDLDSHLLVHDAKRAAALAPGWRRDTIAIVVVDSSHPDATPGWLRSMLRGLRPTATWALASAAEKAEDVTFFAESIGGVDALVLSGLASTVTPASIVATGIPVARIDGLIASTSNWIEAVADRLDVAVHRAAS